MECDRIHPCIRLGMFDLFKGITIITVVVGHTAGIFVSGYFGSFMRSFGNIALYGFVIAAGFEMRKRSMRKCARQLKKAYLKPYLVTACAALGLYFVFELIAYRDIFYTLHKARAVFLSFALGQYPSREYFGIAVDECVPMWFLFALAGGIMLFNLILNYTNGRGTVVAVLLCALIGSTVASKVVIPYCLMHTFSFVPGLYIGYIAKEKKFLKKSGWKELAVFFTSSIILIVMAFKGETVSLADLQFPYGPVSLISVVVVSFAVVYFCTVISRRSNMITNALEWVGHNSFYILCLHAVELVSGLSDIFVWEISVSKPVRFLLYLFFRSLNIAVGMAVICVFKQRKSLKI